MNKEINPEWMSQDLVREATSSLIESMELDNYKYLNIHFIPNILSDTCSIEVKELKDGYIPVDGIALVVVTCNSEEETKSWKKENNIPDFWNVFLDHDRSISKKFSSLNEEYDIPERLSCLVDMHGNVKWLMKNGIGEKRNMLLSNDFNDGFKTLKNIEE